jgi:hypothetical protein
MAEIIGHFVSLIVGDRGGEGALMGRGGRRAGRRRPLGPFLLLTLVSSIALASLQAIMLLQMERDFASPRALMGTVTLIGTTSEYQPNHPCRYSNAGYVLAT